MQLEEKKWHLEILIFIVAHMALSRSKQDTNCLEASDEIRK